VRPVERTMSVDRVSSRVGAVPGKLVEVLASRFPSPGDDPGEDSPDPSPRDLLPHLERLVLQVLRGCCARHLSRVPFRAAAGPQNNGGDTEDSKGTNANANDDPDS
jgi:hypothetical protein